MRVWGAGIALAAWQPWRGIPSSAPAPAPSPSTSPSVATSPAVPDAQTSDEPSDEPDADAAPDPDATIAPCTTSDISVLAVTDKDSYGAGEQPQLSITLSNNGAQPCLMNVGTATQSFEISSGSDVWWRSTDCQTESSDQIVQLEAGQTVSSATALAWDRTRSSVDTCTSARPQAPAGYFHLSVSIGGIEGADTAMFALR